MKTISVRVILFAMVLSIAAVSEALALKPDWNIGDKWKIKAVYKVPYEEGKWSQPVEWEYTVSGVERIESSEFWTVDVSDPSGRQKVETRLWFRASDLFLRKVRVNKYRREKKIETWYHFENVAPAVTRLVPTPFDMPVFPLKTSFGAQFIKAETIEGNLTVQTTVTQSTRSVASTESIEGIRSASGLTEVKCTDSENRTLFTQYYTNGAPWAVYGINEDMKYWLVGK